jgi:hypothetical protein
MTQPRGTQAVPVSMIYLTLLVYAKAVWKKLPTYLSYCTALLGRPSVHHRRLIWRLRHVFAHTHVARDQNANHRQR